MTALNKNEDFIINCPHCNDLILINSNAIKCKKFLHAIYKKTQTNVNPHSIKEKCEQLIKDDLIYGCGKPFYYDGNLLKIIKYEKEE